MRRFWVTARVTGAPAIRDVALRFTTVGAFDSSRMYDDGAHRDGAAGDGIYGGSFPAGAPLRTMRYYVHATDIAGTVQVHPLEAEHTFFWFAEFLARIWCLDSMVDGVADHVGEGILDRFQNRLVEFCSLPLHLHSHLLAA